MLHGNERIIKHKLGLLNLAEELGNVSQACRIMGLSRDTFYRYKEAMDNGGVEASVRFPGKRNYAYVPATEG
jgi:molybdenum-dependent DNA-binding transcriptional regulator ModE